jgi:D-3-phosphoglycerate dehydrogenase
LIKVLLADTLSQKAVELLKEIPEFDILVKTGMYQSQLIEEIKSVDALVVSRASTLELSADILKHADQLKIIIKTGIGFENIDIDFTDSHNIEVKTTPLASSITVAEYTMAQMLGICRFIGPAYQSMKNHKWEKKLFNQGMELFGKTAGIIGMGRIGKEVAKRQLAMGMSVIYYDIQDVQTDLNAKQVTLNKLLTQADFISIHLPLTDSTRNLLSKKEFEKLKEGVVIVNVARGGVIDEYALLKALESNRIRAVALDVYDEEPINDFSLIDHEKVFPAPHIGACTVEAHQRADFEAISILKEFFNV